MLLTLPRIVLAGVSSSVGKTTMTTAFITHIRTNGIRVQPFKDAPFAREEAVYQFTTSGQAEGFAQGNLLATYLHLSFSGFPLAAQRFVAAAKAWQVHTGVSSM